MDCQLEAIPAVVFRGARLILLGPIIETVTEALEFEPARLRLGAEIN